MAKSKSNGTASQAAQAASLMKLWGDFYDAWNLAPPIFHVSQNKSVADLHGQLLGRINELADSLPASDATGLDTLATIFACGDAVSLGKAIEHWRQVVSPLLKRLRRAPRGTPATADISVRPRQPKATVNERMLRTLQDLPESVGWTCEQFAQHLNTSKSAVAATKTWSSLHAQHQLEKVNRATSKRRS